MVNTAALSPTGLIREILSGKSDRALSALEARTWQSWKMALDRSKILPPRQDLAGAFQVFARTGSGAHITDLDGGEFIDLSMGCGTQVLGHAHPAVQTAIAAQVARGWSLSAPSQDQLEFARLIQAAGAANERVALCNSGSEAILYAMRAARSFTGKDKIVTFNGFALGKGDGDSDTPAGAPSAISDIITKLPYGQAIALAEIRRNGADFAAVIVEAIRSSDPTLAHISWLHDLSATCRQAGVLMILDESVTGFRLAYGGAQETLGILPDLVTYGRAAGGGLPLGVVAGRADVMEMFTAAQASGGIAFDASFSGNPLSVAAGTATLQHLMSHRSTLYPALNEMGQGLAEGFNRFTAAERLPVAMRAAGSMFRIVFACDGGFSLADAETAFYVSALNRGVLMHASQCGFLSAAHTTADVTAVLTAFVDSLRDVRDDGLFSR